MILSLFLLALACSVLASSDAQSPTFDRQDRDYRPLQFGKRDVYRPLQFGKREYRPLQFGKRMSLSSTSYLDPLL
ncbi:hypothetical protein KIN20_001055 [Parelaphostrongylus tenuis]|uniref:Uncharacterized protein n=1 Tax=Parelaphostrongylus tenuis TaxID=148309 RepID=A0AAD5MC94_PARTN|nr:hypothetical protein KIN20_001055 [Parelaphostrongylus tenuis]